ncbi:dystrobrevin beta-like [Hetaerina americana]|uniref:dystrobrevin beta-like n=1 Tax=Hetaerina americana TaxID=62018 RepID=UPI003A7F3345
MQGLSGCHHVISLNKLTDGSKKERPKRNAELRITTRDRMKEVAMAATHGEGDGGGVGGGPRQALLQEMRNQDFDTIRFASYRTANKLRFVQKKTNLHAVDIWNVIEAFRENGLNALESSSELGVARLEALLSSLFHALNKRLPPAQQIRLDAAVALLLDWLLAAYGVEGVGRIRVFSVKVALATMCAGKLMDKLRYIFSQISDGNGNLAHSRFDEYLQEVLALPAAVYESPTFAYNDGLAASIFGVSGRITVNDFMDTMMSDPGPHCLVWLPLLHRMASSETVVHPVQCGACGKEGFSGFRYRCQKCHNYQLCQECFWRGRESGTHTNEHDVKEHATHKSPSKQIGHSLRKSFRCVPEKGRSAIPRLPEGPERTLDLSHIVPPSPLPSHNGFPEASTFQSPFDVGSLDGRSTGRSPGCSSPGRYASLDSSTSTAAAAALASASQVDDEHRLIARYAARLAAEARTPGRVGSEANLGLDTSRAQRELIGQLEAKNREIMREIARLRRQQELEAAGGGSNGAGSGMENPALVAELRALRRRKDELESHLGSLQDSRRQLMVQLEGLMKMLKNHQSSPRSTPNSSPRSTKSPPPPPSAPPPSDVQQQAAAMQQQQQQMLLSSQGGGGTSPTPSSSGPPSSGRSLRNDLLVAADSVTNAMSTLVRELNSDDLGHMDKGEPVSTATDFETEEGDEEDEEGGSPVAGGHSTEDDGLDELGAAASSLLWHEEMRQRYEQESMFIAELRARDLGNGLFDGKGPDYGLHQRDDEEDEEGEEEGEEYVGGPRFEDFVPHGPIAPRPALPPRGIRPPGHPDAAPPPAPPPHSAHPPPHSLALRRPPLRPQSDNNNVDMGGGGGGGGGPVPGGGDNRVMCTHIIYTNDESTTRDDMMFKTSNAVSHSHNLKKREASGGDQGSWGVWHADEELEESH